MKRLLHIGIMFLIGHAYSKATGSSEKAFEVFKGLQGNWAIQSDGKTLPIQMSYEAGSNGSIVSEHFGKELSVFFRDGQGFIMIHFCNTGNQPRLRLKEDSRPGLFEFEMFDITNLKSPDTPHVQKIIYRTITDKRMDLEIVWQKGKSQESEKYSLTKI